AGPAFDLDSMEFPFHGALRHPPHVRGILAPAPIIHQDSGLSQPAEQLIDWPSHRLARRVVEGHFEALVTGPRGKIEPGQVHVENIPAFERCAVAPDRRLLESAVGFAVALEAGVRTNPDDELGNTRELR